MKRITAILIASAAFIGCSYVGSASARTLPDCEEIAASYFDKHLGGKYASIRDFIVDQDAEVCTMGATFKKNGATEAEAARFLDKVRTEATAKAVTEREKREVVEVIDRKSVMFMAGFGGYIK
ncbi:hypothetical protein S6a_00021 [Klebsiella phage VLCpiS6a]|nr:hypothetical protein S6a_00021 [Klebsiella phage VLCpiS6a]